jgi:hypothetical protein
MDKYNLATIPLILSMMTVIFSCGFFIGAGTQLNKADHGCIEHKCPGDPYSKMNKPCMPVNCTFPEDAGINNKVYSIYANRTQVGFNFNVTTIPDDATITGMSWHGWDGCYQNETGQNPSDLVIHMTCPNQKAGEP